MDKMGEEALLKEFDRILREVFKEEYEALHGLSDIDFDDLFCSIN